MLHSFGFVNIKLLVFIKTINWNFILQLSPRLDDFAHKLVR